MNKTIESKQDYLNDLNSFLSFRRKWIDNDKELLDFILRHFDLKIKITPVNRLIRLERVNKLYRYKK